MSVFIMALKTAIGKTILLQSLNCKPLQVEIPVQLSKLC